jgi:hypothetical protein
VKILVRSVGIATVLLLLGTCLLAGENKAAAPAPQAAKLADVRGPYFGQKPPGMEPEVFNLPQFADQRGFGVFGDRGKEFFYTASEAGWHWSRIMTTRMKEDGSWTEPEALPFSGTEIDWGVFLSPDGKQIFFGSGRPFRAPEPKSWSLDIWMARRTEHGWSEAVKLPINSDTVSDYASPSARNGNLYWWRFPGGIYRSSFVGGAYASPKRILELGEGTNPFISPDERFILYLQRPKIMISFRNADDTWTTPRDLGPKFENKIAMKGGDWPSLSPDGKYLIFCGTGFQNLYWVGAEVIEDAHDRVEHSGPGGM